jgi:hypothetical protein
MKRFLVAFAASLLVAMACYEVPKDGQLLTIKVLGAPDGAGGADAAGQLGGPGVGGDPVANAGQDPGAVADFGSSRRDGRFYADGYDHRTVEIKFPGGATAGKPLTVTTSLGIINPSADTAGKRSLALKTTNGESITFELWAERTSGAGRITIEGPDGARATDDFWLDPVTEQLSIGREAGTYVADGTNSVTLSIGLTSEQDSFQDVVVKTSLGVLSPDKKDEAARARTVRVSNRKPANLTWDLGQTPGVAVITAELANSMAVESVRLRAAKPAQASLEFRPRPPAETAAAQTPVEIGVFYNAPEGQKDSVTLTTTLGELNPAGTTEEARRTTTVPMVAGKTSVVKLNVGRTPGIAVISASSPSAPSIALSLKITPLLPERLALELTSGSTLQSTRRDLSATVRLARTAGNGPVSTGTEIQLTSCCNDGGGRQECSKYLSHPAFLEDVDGDNREAVTITLTPTGKAFVDAIGSNANLNLPVDLYAFVLKAPTDPMPTCDTVEMDVTQFAAFDGVELELERSPPPAP